MTTFPRFIFFGLNLTLATAVFAAAADQITVSGAYIRGLPPTAPNTSAYMTILNTSDEDLVLTGARTAIAGSVMLHETHEEDGRIAMRHLMSAIVPAGGELVLESGGVHLMLMNLKETPGAGEQVELTLTFQGGIEKTLLLPVRSVLIENMPGH